MRRKGKQSGAVENYDPDKQNIRCETCYKYRTCERAMEGTFCTAWQSADPDRDPEQDPNRAWRRGEDVDL